jgi:ketosteroid isomerase-like protein
MHTIARCLAIAAVGLAVVGPGAAAPQSSDSVKQTLQGLYTKESEAAENKDVDGMTADYDPSVVAVTATGEQKDYQELVAAAQQIVSMAQTIKDTTTVESVSVDGNKAVAEIHDSTMITVQEPTTKSDMVIAVTSSSHDTWVKSNDHWRIVKSVEIEHSGTVDGQPMPGI